MYKTMLIIIFFIQSLLSISMSKPKSNPPANANGFSIDIFHRDSLHSPYYNESLSSTETLVNAVRRSLNRSQRLSSAGSTETDVVRSIHSGDYLMRYKIGQQQVPSLGILDTGGSLVWTQCFPCTKCIKQNPPLYEPGNSSTYEVISCDEFECARSRFANMCQQKGVKTCIYSSSYEDGTSTSGKLSKDTLILSSAGGTTTFHPNMVFGCSSRAQSNFYGYESGVIGLGRGIHSLVSQLGPSAKGKFSYCLVAKGSTRSSRLKFGDNAEVSGEGVVNTPLVFNPNSDYYYVSLFGFDINGGTKHMYAYNFGNLIVDSGWAETRIPDQMYADLNRTLIDALKSLKLKVIDDPKRTLDLCFHTKSDRLKLPIVTLHFGGGSVSFGKDNMFVRTTPNSLCLAILPEGGEGTVVLGYIAQANFVVGYDTEKNLMSFKPTDCTKMA